MIINTRDFNIYKALHYKVVENLKTNLSNLELLYCAFILWFFYEDGYAATGFDLDKDLNIVDYDQKGLNNEYYLEVFPDFKGIKTLKINEDKSITLTSDMIIRLAWDSNSGCIKENYKYKIECDYKIVFLYYEGFTYDNLINILYSGIDYEIDDEDISFTDYEVISITEKGKQQLINLMNSEETWKILK